MEHIESDLPITQPPSQLGTVVDNTLDCRDGKALCDADRRKPDLLYRDEQGEPAPALSPPAAINACSIKKAVLVIGNDRSLLRTYERLLRHNGYVVRTALEGDEGLRLHEDCGPFFVIIVDCRLHSWSEVAATMRRRDPLQRILAGAIRQLDEDEEPTPFPSDLPEISPVIKKEDLTRELGKLEFWATKAEVDQAYKALTPAQLRKLQKIADYRARVFGRASRGRDGADLLREAVLKVFIGNNVGGRRWYKSVDFFWFLVRAVTSVADNWKKRGALELQTYRACEFANCDAEGQETSLLQSVPSKDPAAEQRLLASAEVERIFRIFERDREASLVLGGWAEGIGRKEIIEECGLTCREYDDAAKRIRTTLKTKNGSGANGKN